MSMHVLNLAILSLIFSAMPALLVADEDTKGSAVAQLQRIQLSPDGKHFVRAGSNERFFVWGFNYDHDADGRLLEDYWHDEWETVAEDFREMKDLGANVVRIHLQVAAFLEAADKPNDKSLRQLARLVKLAEETGLYLDLTGLGCYHKQDVPEWYDALDEAGRWQAQAVFWEAVAATCAGSGAVFCYDLMNEPILAGKDKETDWLAGAFGGKHFVQRITLDLASRTREQVAAAWVEKLVTAIRKHDEQTLITVGAIPWVLTFPKAQPLFYSEAVAKHLDFVSIHVYPRKGEVDKAIAAIKTFQIGKPIVIEETFPLHCGQEEFEQFVEGSRKDVDGYIGFYWGKTIKEYDNPDAGFAGALMRGWLEYFRERAPETSGGTK